MAVVENSAFDLGIGGPSSAGEVNADGDGDYRREMKELEDMLSKLNPMAEEFVPPPLTTASRGFENGMYVTGFRADQSLDDGVNYGFAKRALNSHLLQFV